MLSWRRDERPATNEHVGPSEDVRVALELQAQIRGADRNDGPVRSVKVVPQGGNDLAVATGLRHDPQCTRVRERGARNTPA